MARRERPKVTTFEADPRQQAAEVCGSASRSPPRTRQVPELVSLDHRRQVTRDEFDTADPAGAGRAVFNATARFHKSGLRGGLD
jgi:hypothetical protein